MALEERRTHLSEALANGLETQDEPNSMMTLQPMDMCAHCQELSVYPGCLQAPQCFSRQLGLAQVWMNAPANAKPANGSGLAQHTPRHFV